MLGSAYNRVRLTHSWYISKKECHINLSHGCLRTHLLLHNEQLESKKILNVLMHFYYVRLISPFSCLNCSKFLLMFIFIFHVFHLIASRQDLNKKIIDFNQDKIKIFYFHAQTLESILMIKTISLLMTRITARHQKGEQNIFIWKYELFVVSDKKWLNTTFHVLCSIVSWIENLNHGNLAVLYII